MNNAYLLTGGNLGNRFLHLQTAKTQIEKHCGTVMAASSIYETAAWGNTEQPAYLNQVLMVRTSLDAGALLQNILSIEKEMGRVREVKYASRVIDIDILFFNREIIDQPGLQVPHPHIASRRFVLTPLCELVPKKMHPVLNQSMAKLLAACKDPLPVTLWQQYPL